MKHRQLLRLGAVVIGTLLSGCIGSSSADLGAGSGSAARRQFPLDSLQTANIGAKGSTLRVWLALTDDQHMEGLMHVTADEIADDQGMLFVFPDERLRGFWMKNTVTSLDIAFARFDGTIVATHTMPPLTLRTFPSYEPAMFALEMKAGAFERLGLKTGDKLDIPTEVFKAAP